MDEITCSVDSIRFRNNENGFTVFDAVNEEGNVRFVAVGGVMSISTGERAKLSGFWTVHKQYGRQFKIAKYVPIAHTGLAGIEKYLGSGIVKGIGKATAHAIIEKFGEDSFNVIEQTPNKLLEISGIGKIKLDMIKQSYDENKNTKDAMLKLQELDISVNQSMILLKLYGTECVKKVLDNPYRLIDDVDNIGFRTADKIAKNGGITHTSEFRIDAGIKYMLTWARREGHTYLPQDVLTRATYEMLDVDSDLVTERIHVLISKNHLSISDYNGVSAVALPPTKYVEANVAKKLYSLMSRKSTRIDFDPVEEVSLAESNRDYSLAPLQRDALIAMFSGNAVVITGGPGTGKTTILHLAIDIMDSRGISYELCAPTGRAAKRMSLATGKNAKTIHRLLEYSQADKAFLRDADTPLECDYIIVDEMSMIDIWLMDALLTAMNENTKLIMVGDADQLPSVGAGNVLRDILTANICPSIRLVDIFRQGDRSLIVENAHRINNGENPILDDVQSDFLFEQYDNTDSLLARILELSVSEDGSVLQTKEPFLDVQVLAPMKKGILGVINLNGSLQAKMNPPAEDKNECIYSDTVFRVGDRVMQIKNNYSMKWTKNHLNKIVEDGVGVFNGDIGTIMSIDTKNDIIEVMFDDGATALYDQTNLEELDLAYCISIHKSQGSEFPIVIVPIMSGSPGFMTRNLLYTAVTRARTQVIILGQESAVLAMSKNNNIRMRYTGLAYMLKEYESVQKNP